MPDAPDRIASRQSSRAVSRPSGIAVSVSRGRIVVSLQGRAGSGGVSRRRFGVWRLNINNHPYVDLLRSSARPLAASERRYRLRSVAAGRRAQTGSVSVHRKDLSINPATTITIG